MNCNIIAIDGFHRDVKRLSKKYLSLKSDLKGLEAQLLQTPRTGVMIRENTYKIRLAVKSKGRGKSGGMRIITYVLEVEVQIEENEKQQTFTVILVAIYDKSEVENMTDKELRTLIDEIEMDINDSDTE
jgi:mRNA-degrading endonuclease RelE of RelBE toxin-antitoxin system